MATASTNIPTTTDLQFNLPLKHHESTQLGINEVLLLSRQNPKAVEKSWVLNLPPLQPEDFYLSQKQEQQDNSRFSKGEKTNDSIPPIHHCVQVYTLQK